MDKQTKRVRPKPIDHESRPVLDPRLDAFVNALAELLAADMMTHPTIDGVPDESIQLRRAR